MAKTKTNSAVRRRSGSLRYLTREGIRNIRSNRMMSIASIIVLTSCLLITGIAFLLTANINVALRGVQDQNVIMVYLKDDTTADEAGTVDQDIRMLPDVDHTKFIPKEEAYKQQLKSLGEDAKLMDGLDKNPLPDAYQVTLKTLDNYDSVLQSLKTVDHVESVRGNSELAGQVRHLRRSVSVISISIIVMLLLVSLFIIANTIRITMFNRRLEIGIMKAVGATNWFVRWPFIIEGSAIGALSSVLAELLVFVVYRITSGSMKSIFTVLGAAPVPFSHYAGWLFLIFILIGILAGVLGSSLSMGKYLREQGSVVSNEE